MPSGWTRWLFEQYEFPFEVVYPQHARRRQSEEQVRRAGLHRRRDRRGGGAVGAEAVEAAAVSARRIRRPSRKSTAAGWAASPTTRPCPQLKKFVESGGASRDHRQFHQHGRALRHPGEELSGRKRSPTARSARLPREKFYIPGSLMKAHHRQHQSAGLRHAGSRWTCSSTTARCSAWSRPPSLKKTNAGGVVLRHGAAG